MCSQVCVRVCVCARARVWQCGQYCGRGKLGAGEPAGYPPPRPEGRTCGEDQAGQRPGTGGRRCTWAAGRRGHGAASGGPGTWGQGLRCDYGAMGGPRRASCGRFHVPTSDPASKQRVTGAPLGRAWSQGSPPATSPIPLFHYRPRRWGSWPSPRHLQSCLGVWQHSVGLGRGALEVPSVVILCNAAPRFSPSLIHIVLLYPPHGSQGCFEFLAWGWVVAHGNQFLTLECENVCNYASVRDCSCACVQGRGRVSEGPGRIPARCSELEFAQNLAQIRTAPA